MLSLNAQLSNFLYVIKFYFTNMYKFHFIYVNNKFNLINMCRSNFFYTNKFNFINIHESIFFDINKFYFLNMCKPNLFYIHKSYVFYI